MSASPSPLPWGKSTILSKEKGDQIMRVIKKGKSDKYEDMYTKRYEFRLCGGSIDPKTIRMPKREEKK